MGRWGGGCSLALDRSDRPHISYFDFGAARLKYATFADGAWLSEVIDSRADVGVSTSIAVSRSGLPSISYYDGLNHDLCLASADRLGGWSIEVVDSMGDVGSVSSLQLDARGEPHIAYRDATLGVVKYARREGGRWVREIVTPSIGLGGELGLALDDQGLARVAYYDATTSDLAYASRAVEFTALPRAGSWPVGARRSIVWGGTGRVAVELSGDGGATYSPLADGLTQGHFDFTVPNMVSGACKVRLLREVPRSVGVSDTLFGITPGVVLLSMATEAIPEGNGWAVRWRTDPGPPDLLGYRLERAQQGEVWRTIYESAGATLYDDHQGAPDARYRLFAITPTKQEVLVGESSHMLGGPLLVGPSPYRGGRLIISYVLPKQGRVEVGLYDISGRRVAILAEGPEVAGTHSVAWKGTTDTGRTVPSGIYFVKLKSDNDVAVRRIAVCR